MIDLSEITSVISTYQTPPSEIRSVMSDKAFRKIFHSKPCPKCGMTITPITYGESNEMHGYKLICPECEKFIGWGGKVNKFFQDLVESRNHENNG